MPAPYNALQAGIYSRLTGYSALTTALGGAKIYDHVPQNTAFPYVMIGDDTGIELDTKTSTGWELTLTIHAWDYAAAGRKSVKALLAHIYDALHRQEASITVTGFTLVMMNYEFHETFQESANEGASDRYYHGVMRFRAIIRAIN
jgi:hypothetical protein